MNKILSYLTFTLFTNLYLFYVAFYF